MVWLLAAVGEIPSSAKPLDLRGTLTLEKSLAAVADNGPPIDEEARRLFPL
jgi:hypothetical protein